METETNKHTFIGVELRIFGTAWLVHIKINTINLNVGIQVSSAEPHEHF